LDLYLSIANTVCSKHSNSVRYAYQTPLRNSATMVPQIIIAAV